MPFSLRSSATPRAWHRLSGCGAFRVIVLARSVERPPSSATPCLLVASFPVSFEPLSVHRQCQDSDKSRSCDEEVALCAVLLPASFFWDCFAVQSPTLRSSVRFTVLSTVHSTAPSRE